VAEDTIVVHMITQQLQNVCWCWNWLHALLVHFTVMMSTYFYLKNVCKCISKLYLIMAPCHMLHAV